MEYMDKSKAFRHRKEQIGNCNVLTQKVTIPTGGEHKVEIFATNRDGNIFSKVKSIMIITFKERV